MRDVYLDGDMTKEERDKRYQKIEAERRVILEEKIGYQNDIEHYEALLENVLDKYKFDGIDGVEGHLGQIVTLSQQISGITNDKERSEIVHRHFKKITYENAVIEINFKSGPRKAKASFIKIYLYNDTVLYYYFVPNNGRNGGYFKADADGNVLTEIFPEYQRRFVDKGKLRRRKQEHDEKQDEIQRLFPREKNYLHGIKEVCDLLEVKFGTAQYWLSKTGPAAKAVNRIGRYLYIQRDELINELLNSDSHTAVEAAQRAMAKINANDKEK